METARPATAADLDDLARLWGEAVAELDGQRGGEPLAGSLWRSDVRGFLEAALDDPDRTLMVGLIDDVTVGVASLHADRARREPLGHLELIYVEATARKVGVASAMLELALDVCRRWGVVGLDAPALPGNRSAKSFFEVHGLAARMLVMHRALGGPAR